MDRPTRRAVKTYTRQRKPLRDENPEPQPKRRRLNRYSATQDRTHGQGTFDGVQEPAHIHNVPVASSSPGATSSTTRSSSPRRYGGEVFPDRTRRSSSPPSSPPLLSSEPPAVAQGPISTLLGHEPAATSTAAISPLSESTGNARKRPATKEARLVQMQLDLGIAIRKTCQSCGMEYIPSNSEDAALHKRFHAKSLCGVEMSRAFVDYAKVNAIWKDGSNAFIAMVDRTDSLMARNQAKKVMQVVNSELSAVQMSNRELWSELDVGSDANFKAPLNGPYTKSEGTADVPRQTGRFKVYVYVEGRTCIGLCLAERIRTARRVLTASPDAHGALKSSTAHQSSSIATSPESFDAVLGIQRIWTSNSHRKQGIARRLLDTAVNNFLYGVQIPKDMVAFSQPTESGGKLARKWFAKEDGWLVYSDQ